MDSNKEQQTSTTTTTKTTSRTTTVSAADGEQLISLTSADETIVMESVDDSNAETSSCNVVDDDLLSSDVTATVVYTATSFESEKFNDLSKQKFELERL